MKFIFDLDGTLIDNDRALREAYRQAGIDLTDGMMQMPAATWKIPPTVEQQKIKREAYPEMLCLYAAAGPAMYLWNRLQPLERFILTSASIAGACDALRHLGINTTALIDTGLDISQKIDYVKRLAEDETVFYVDANNLLCKIIANASLVTGITFYQKAIV